MNNHDENAAGHEHVVAAMECMVELAKDINELKRQHERLVRTQELRSTFASSGNIDIVSFGELVLEVFDSLQL